MGNVMRDFRAIQQSVPLTDFLDSRLGTLYLAKLTPGADWAVIRHLDRELPPSRTAALADLIGATQRWIDQRPELARWIWVQQPVEVGRDFIVRPHHVYTTSLESYESDEDPPETPPELEQMRSVLRTAMGRPASAGDAIVEAILARSLLEPSGKTYLGEETFVVVDPKVTPEDVEAWFALGPEGSREP
jgi:hypothetical protein